MRPDPDVFELLTGSPSPGFKPPTRGQAFCLGLLIGLLVVLYGLIFTRVIGRERDWWRYSHEEGIDLALYTSHYSSKRVYPVQAASAVLDEHWA